MRRELAVAADPCRHVPADQRRHRLSAAGERHVIDPPRIDAGSLGHESRQDVIGAARGTAAPGERLGPAAELVDQRPHVAERRRRRHGDDLVFTGEPGDRRGLIHRHRRVVPQRRADHHQPGDEQRPPVSALRVGELRQPDRPRGARHVLHFDDAGEVVGVDDVLQGSRRLIPPAARCGRRDDGQVVDGLRGGAGCEQRAEHGGCMDPRHPRILPWAAVRTFLIDCAPPASSRLGSSGPRLAASGTSGPADRERKFLAESEVVGMKRRRVWAVGTTVLAIVAMALAFTSTTSGRVQYRGLGHRSV